MKKGIIKILNVMCFFLLLTAAKCPNDDKVEPVATTGSLTVTIKIAQRSSGAVIPDNLLSAWAIQASLLSDAGTTLKTQVYNSNIITFTDLIPGNYKIKADGTVTHATAGRLSLTNGSGGGQVQAGKTASSPDIIYYY